MIPDATPIDGARFVRLANCTDDYVMAVYNEDGTLTWKRTTADVRDQFPGALVEARYEPLQLVPIHLPIAVVEHLADGDWSSEDLSDVVAACARVWAGLDYADRETIVEHAPMAGV